MKLHPCPSCACHLATDATACPQCGAALAGSTRDFRLPAAAILMGLALGGCIGQSTALYGVAITDSGKGSDPDGDGYVGVDDCDEGDPEIHIDATETPGDGVDSNCNDEDDS
jgi:hypothetical protein